MIDLRPANLADEGKASAFSTPDLQPVLTGDTVVIRPLRLADWDGLFAAASDPLIWAGHPAQDRWQEPLFRAFFADALVAQSAFAVVDRASDAIIGSSRYHGFDTMTGEVEIGWTFLTRAHWGGTTNREVKALMLGHAFTFARTVVFWVGEDNVRSQRAVAKIGGHPRPGFATRPGSSARHIVFAIERTII